jgi:hypothetical protein
MGENSINYNNTLDSLYKEGFIVIMEFIEIFRNNMNIKENS